MSIEHEDSEHEYSGSTFSNNLISTMNYSNEGSKGMRVSILSAHSGIYALIGCVSQMKFVHGYRS